MPRIEIEAGRSSELLRNLSTDAEGSLSICVEVELTTFMQQGRPHPVQLWGG